MSLIETMNLKLTLPNYYVFDYYSSAQLPYMRVLWINYCVFEYYSSDQLPYMRMLWIYRSLVQERTLMPLYPYELRMSS